MKRNSSSRRLFLQLSCMAGSASLLSGFGCEPVPSRKSPAKRAAPASALRVIVVDDPELGEAIGREWHARTESEIETAAATKLEMENASRLPGDVVVFPSAMLGQLVERGLIQPLSESMLASDTIAIHDIFPLTRRQELTWGERTYALPLSSPLFVLGYRSDLLERLQLAVPANWDDYQAVAEKLADRSLLEDAGLPEDQPWRAVAEPTGAGFGACLLLARAAAYSSHREHVTLLFDTARLEPLINRAPYVRALGELVSCFKVSGSMLIETPGGAFSELLAGRCGLALGWHADVSAAGEDISGPPVGFAQLPGSSVVFSFDKGSWENRRPEDEWQVPFLGAAGRLAAVTSSSGDHAGAEGLVGWLAGTEVSSRIAGHSSETGFFRATHRSTVELWVGDLPDETAAQYFDVVQQAQSRAQAMTTVRLPGSERYLSALDEAVQRATVDGQDPQLSLDQAAADWRKLTAEIGATEQRTALFHSLGLTTD